MVMADSRSGMADTPEPKHSTSWRLRPLVLRLILRTVLPLFRAINDAVTGHIEKLSKIMGNLVEEAGGGQYRCPQCGSFGPKVSDH